MLWVTLITSWRDIDIFIIKDNNDGLQLFRPMKSATDVLNCDGFLSLWKKLIKLQRFHRIGNKPKRGNTVKEMNTYMDEVGNYIIK